MCNCPRQSSNREAQGFKAPLCHSEARCAGGGWGAHPLLWCATDAACGCSVVPSRQATMAGPWPPAGACVSVRPGKRTSLVSAARSLQTRWPSWCAPACTLGYDAPAEGRVARRGFAEPRGNESREWPIERHRQRLNLVDRLVSISWCQSLWRSKPFGLHRAPLHAVSIQRMHSACPSTISGTPGNSAPAAPFCSSGLRACPWATSEARCSSLTATGQHVASNLKLETPMRAARPMS